MNATRYFWNLYSHREGTKVGDNQAIVPVRRWDIARFPMLLGCKMVELTWDSLDDRGNPVNLTLRFIGCYAFGSLKEER